MTTEDIDYGPNIGSEITSTIGGMIAMAMDCGGATVRTEFNGVTIRVRADSDLDLIYRDWSRAMSGYIDKTVGPYPAHVLTAAEKASDARIERANKRRQKERDAQYRAEARAKTAATKARLAGAPRMDVSDPAAWKLWKDNNQDPYGSGVIRYAEAWAQLMQAEIAAGATLEDVADETGHAADTEGITGFMHGAAVQCLATCWVHGDRLRKWHNQRWGAGPDREGTVNPAVLTITPKE